MDGERKCRAKLRNFLGPANYNVRYGKLDELLKHYHGHDGCSSQTNSDSHHLESLRLPEQAPQRLPTHDIDQQITAIPEQASVDALSWLIGITWNAD